MAGIIEELDETEVPMLAELPENNDPHYATLGFFRLGLAYNEEQLEANNVKPPKSWDDLWDEDYAGHIIIGTVPGGGNQQAFFDYLWETEGSMEAAEAKFEELIPSVKAFVTTQPELEAAVGSGDAWVTIASDTRANLVAATGAPVKWVAPEPGALDWPMFFDVPKNSTNKAAAVRVHRFHASEGTTGEDDGCRVLQPCEHRGSALRPNPGPRGQPRGPCQSPSYQLAAHHRQAAGHQPLVGRSESARRRALRPPSQ